MPEHRLGNRLTILVRNAAREGNASQQGCDKCSRPQLSETVTLQILLAVVGIAGLNWGFREIGMAGLQAVIHVVSRWNHGASPPSVSIRFRHWSVSKKT